MGARARLSSWLAALKARPRLLAGLQTAAVAVLLLVLAYEMRTAVREAWPLLLNADLRYVALGIAHAQAETIADDIAERIGSVRPRAEIELVAPLGAVVGTNTGPGGAGLVWAHEAP